jgi:hypothetical protein
VHSRRSSSLRVSRNALLGVGLIWALSIAMASPVAYHQSLFHRDLSNQTFCWDQWPNKRHKKAYVVCTFVFGYLLPLLLICFCYAKVGAERAGQSLGGRTEGPPNQCGSSAAELWLCPLLSVASRVPSTPVCPRLCLLPHGLVWEQSYLKFDGCWASLRFTSGGRVNDLLLRCGP